MTDEQKEKIAMGIKEDSEWLVRMVENLLSITRIDSGQVKIIKTPTVLEELIDSVMLKFKQRYPSQKVEIEIPDEVIIIPMDAILIEQVIVNILENAVQHAKEITRLTLRVFTLSDSAIFEIKDNGCGINPKHLETLFSGYYTSSNEPADSQKKNAGIGLSVCATLRNNRFSADEGRLPGGRFTLKDLEIDYNARKVFINKEEIHLTQTEYNIVALLSENCGKMMTYCAIIKAILGGYALENSMIK